MAWWHERERRSLLTNIPPYNSASRSRAWCAHTHSHLLLSASKASNFNIVTMDLFKKGKEKVKRMGNAITVPRSARSCSRSPAHYLDEVSGPPAASPPSSHRDVSLPHVSRTTTIAESSPPLRTESSPAQDVPALSASLSILATQVSPFDSQVEIATKIGWNGFKQSLDILRGASAAFPPLQSAVAELIKVIAVIEVCFPPKLA